MAPSSSSPSKSGLAKRSTPLKPIPAPAITPKSKAKSKRKAEAAIEIPGSSPIVSKRRRVSEKATKEAEKAKSKLKAGPAIASPVSKKAATPARADKAKSKRKPEAAIEIPGSSPIVSKGRKVSEKATKEAKKAAANNNAKVDKNATGKQKGGLQQREKRGPAKKGAAAQKKVGSLDEILTSTNFVSYFCIGTDKLRRKLKRVRGLPDDAELPSFSDIDRGEDVEGEEEDDEEDEESEQDEDEDDDYEDEDVPTPQVNKRQLSRAEILRGLKR